MIKFSTSPAHIVGILNALRMKLIALIAEIHSSTIALTGIVECQKQISVVCVQQTFFARTAAHSHLFSQVDLFPLVLLMTVRFPAIRAVIPFPTDFPATLATEIQIFS
mgnify:CR=1 FL=1